ncbi:MAG: glycosyltransferase, partial [Candidatus Altiarchaeales archaeon]|nr:glycosyltransferase [Candidatus Altiarchaeales archaeon]
MDVSIVLPCRNEEKALPHSIEEIKKVMGQTDYSYELIVSDSSCDQSPEIAREHGVKLVKHDEEGYGTAYHHGIKQACGRYLFFADPDGTYSFQEIPNFIKQLEEDYDLVLGDRFKGHIIGDAMPPLHRYLGNPLLSALFRLLFNSDLRDVHCGMRAIKREKYLKLGLKTSGMEYATEMLIKALQKNMKIKQLPIDYHPRLGESKLKSLGDGYRHLRFMLLYSPTWLFLAPGTLLTLTGLITTTLLYVKPISLFGLTFYYHLLYPSTLLILTGSQILMFGLFAKTYAVTRLQEDNKHLKLFHQHFNLEKALFTGAL